MHPRAAKRFLSETFRDIPVLSDANVSVGSKAEIVCLVDGIRNQVRAQDCSWISPNGTEFFASGRNKSEAGINVRIDSRRNECILTIENVSNTHSGFWECAVTQGRETVGRSFSFVQNFCKLIMLYHHVSKLVFYLRLIV